MAKKPTRMIITGVPPYNQDMVVTEKNKTVIAGCGPVAALMLLAYYDRRNGYRRLIATQYERDKEMPDGLIRELRQKMHTINDIKNGQEWGMTLPNFFQSGLDSYITDRYGKTKIESYSTATIGVDLDDVFAKSVSLIKSGKIHAMLLDWEGDSGIFPNHYVVVVGYRMDGNNKKLIVNPGWGYDFQVVDMTDKCVRPATLYWIDSIEQKPEVRGDGHEIGPKANYTWVTKNGEQQLKPRLRKHFSTEYAEWGESADTETLVANTELKHCFWYD